MRSIVLLPLAFVIGLALFAEPALAQTAMAQITGMITDQTRAGIPGADVTVLNVDTGIRRVTVSNDVGYYTVPLLPAGNYEITVQMPGFRPINRRGITLLVNQVGRIDFVMEIGEVSQAITVLGQSPLLETEDANVGTVVNERAIQELPLNVRDSIHLVVLTPGVTPRSAFGASQIRMDVGRNFFQSDFNVGGGSGYGQEILIDGAPSTTSDRNFATYIPPVDSTQEFRVQVNPYSSEFDRTTGGVVNILTKSGTNQFHGTAFEFHRNSVLDANDFFANRAGIEKPSFRRHQFGGNLGGPISKDRTFFFVAYEGLRQAFPATVTSTVPTDLQRSGDFSQTFTRDGKLITIYDPLTLRTDQSGKLIRNPFPANFIPKNRWDPVAEKVLEFYPRPNRAGDPITGANNFIFADQSAVDRNGIDVRIDHNFAPANKIFGRWSRQKRESLTARSWDNLASPGTLSIVDTFDHAVIEDTHIFSPTAAGNLRLSFTRGLPDQSGLSQGFDLSQLGFPESYTRVASSGFPKFSISDVAEIGNAESGVQPRNTYALQAAGMKKMFARHFLKVGVDFRLLEFNSFANGRSAGAFAFGRNFTQGPDPLQSRADAGFGLASFLLGMGTGGRIDHITALALERTYWAFYVQDDWKVTPRLTVNLGLRYSLEIGQRERFNRLQNLDLESRSPLSDRVGLELKGQLRFLGTDGWPTNQLDTDKNNFAPRLGIAYKVTNKTVARAGYGIFYNPMNVIAEGTHGFDSNTDWVATLDGLRPENLLRDPYPKGFNLPTEDRDPLTNIGFFTFGYVRSERVGYAQLWSLSVQHQLGPDFLVDLGYWGNKGTKLMSGFWNINVLPNKFLELKTALLERVPNPFFGVITSGALSGPTVTRQQLLLPFPQYPALVRNRVSAGSSSYHGFTLQVQKRLGEGLSFLGAYTISKNVGDNRGRENVGGVASVYNMENRRADRGLLPWDVPQRFVGSFVYDLPFGEGRRFGSNMQPVLNAMLGGWAFSGIVTFQSGFPVALPRNAVNNGQSASVEDPTITQWFDTSVFSAAPPFTFGNVGPVLPDVRQDGIHNLDFTLAKNFPFADRFRLQFRTEFFNAFNSPQFARPQTNFLSQDFGRVSAQANAPRSVQVALKLYW